MEKHIKLNKVKERILFFSPTVQAGYFYKFNKS